MQLHSSIQQQRLALSKSPSPCGLPIAGKARRLRSSSHVSASPRQEGGGSWFQDLGERMRATTSNSTLEWFGSSRRIADSFRSINEVQSALRKEGLESCNLIVAIDCTKSNEWTGKVSNGGRSLHSLDPSFPMNPYQMAINVIGKTLSAFDDDNLIPCYGFGDATTLDKRVFSFQPKDQPCLGVEGVEAAYRAIMPMVKLSGPSSFAPVINQAIKLIAGSGNHNYPLSIVMVGVGDGPWDTMKDFGRNLKRRRFDNFQFVDMTSLMGLAYDPARMQARFALQALMKVPEQYKTIKRLGLLGSTTPLGVYVPPPPPCPPPSSSLFPWM